MKQAKNTENETTKKLNKDTHNNSIQTQQFNTKQIEDTNQNQPKNQGVPVVLVIEWASALVPPTPFYGGSQGDKQFAING